MVLLIPSDPLSKGLHLGREISEHLVAGDRHHSWEAEQVRSVDKLRLNMNIQLKEKAVGTPFP